MRRFEVWVFGSGHSFNQTFPPYISTSFFLHLSYKPVQAPLRGRRHQCLNSPWIYFSFDLVIQCCAPWLATQNPCYRSWVQRRKADIEFFSTQTFSCTYVCATSCICPESHIRVSKAAVGAGNDEWLPGVVAHVVITFVAGFWPLWLGNGWG